KATSDLTQMGDFFSPLWREADGVLIVGCRLTQLVTGTWSLPLPASRIHIDIDRSEIGRHVDVSSPGSCGVQADARLALEAILAGLPGENRPPWTALPPRARDWRLPGIDIVGPLRRVLPRDAIVAADVTRLTYILMADFPLDCPRTWLHPAGAV